MNKKELSERDICTKFITPALREAGWDELTQLREEVSFTKGRIIVRGKLVTRGKAKRADYILYYKPSIPLAVIEAKDNHCSVGDPKHISTSYVERQNLTMRMSMRRFTRLTNAFSKKLENHAAMVSLYFMYYNFGRVHQTLRVTPAMQAGIASHVWEIEEIISLLDTNQNA